MRKKEREEEQRIGREARSDQEVILKLLTFIQNPNRVHFSDSAEKRPSRLLLPLEHCVGFPRRGEDDAANTKHIWWLTYASEGEKRSNASVEKLEAIKK